MIRARGLTHEFNGHNGIRDMDLDVPPGHIFGLVGPSGSGKTTAVRLMLGLIEPQAGSIEVMGTDPNDFDSDQRARIGYLPQDSALDPALSLRHNLNFMASVNGMPTRSRWMPGKRSRRARARIDEVLELLDLQDHQRTRLGNASTGEQRRVALAAAMVHSPDLLVLDEPTAGIDPVLREQLWMHFRELRSEGTTLFVTTQYVTEADSCDLVALMVDGHLLRTAPPDRLRRDAFGGDLVRVEYSDADVSLDRLGALEGVIRIERWTGPREVLVVVDDTAAAMPRIQELLGGHDDAHVMVAPHTPSFDEVFVRMVRAHRDDGVTPALARRDTMREDSHHA